MGRYARGRCFWFRSGAARRKGVISEIRWYFSSKRVHRFMDANPFGGTGGNVLFLDVRTDGV